jgi:hypothetical protein
MFEVCQNHYASVEKTSLVNEGQLWRGMRIAETLLAFLTGSLSFVSPYMQ